MVQAVISTAHFRELRERSIALLLGRIPIGLAEALNRRSWITALLWSAISRREPRPAQQLRLARPRDGRAQGQHPPIPQPLGRRHHGPLHPRQCAGATAARRAGDHQRAHREGARKPEWFDLVKKRIRLGSFWGKSGHNWEAFDDYVLDVPSLPYFASNTLAIIRWACAATIDETKRPFGAPGTRRGSRTQSDPLDHFDSVGSSTLIWPRNRLRGPAKTSVCSKRDLCWIESAGGFCDAYFHK